MHRLLIPFLFFVSFSAFAQPGVSEVVEIDGKKYYQHKVVDGNTLWGMQGMYGLPYQEIVEANPGFDGLKEGAIVLVPVKNESQVETAQIETRDYKVKNKETLYALSIKFKTSIDKLIELNPILADNELKKGQIIQVPGKAEDAVETPVEVPEITTENPFSVDTISTEGSDNNVLISFSDTTVQHVVLEHETLYKISKRYMVSIDELMELNDLDRANVRVGQVLVVPVKNERVQTVPIKEVLEGYDPDSSDSIVFNNKETYQIALLLPFHLEYGKGYSEYISNLATQYYMGATMAVDSLERMGLKAKLYVYDTKNDTSVVEGILTKPEFSNMDMVIGPLLPNNMGQVANYCKQNKVRMVCPVSIDSELLQNNRLIYASVPSNITLIQGLAKFMLANNKADNIILVKPLDKESLPLYEAYRKTFLEAKVEGARPSLVETTVEGFNAHMRKNVNNCFVIPTLNRKTASKFMNNVNRSSFRSKKDGIYIYATREWNKFTELNNAFKNKYNLHFASPTFIDYYSDEMIALNKKFRAQYKTDMSRVAIQAYDIMMFYCTDFFIEGASVDQMMNAIDMKQISIKDGYENSNVFIIEQEEFELIQVGSSLAR